jgi:hypothetical protein
MIKKIIPYCIFAAALFAFMIIPLHGFTDDGIVTIFVGDNEKLNVNPIFNEKDKLYPGCEIQKILKIENKHNYDVTVKKIAVNKDTLKISKMDKNIDIKDELSSSFLKSIYITIKNSNSTKNLMKEIIFEGSLEELINGANVDIKLKPKETIELKYILKMAENINEQSIAGIKAICDFDIEIEDSRLNSSKSNLGSNASSPNIAPSTPLIDIENHWSHDCIKTLFDKKLIEGYEDGNIKPDRFITRAEIAVLIGRALNIKEENNQENLLYKDEIPNWARGYIIALTKKGIFDGYDDMTFRPDKNITREEMTAVLVRAFEKTSKSKDKISFKDQKEISKWAREYVSSGTENKLIEGYEDNTFKPKKNITRAETFTMVCKLLKLHDKHEELAVPKIKEEN